MGQFWKIPSGLPTAKRKRKKPWPPRNSPVPFCRIWKSLMLLQGEVWQQTFFCSKIQTWITIQCLRFPSTPLELWCCDVQEYRVYEQSQTGATQYHAIGDVLKTIYEKPERLHSERLSKSSRPAGRVIFMGPVPHWECYSLACSTDGGWGRVTWRQMTLVRYYWMDSRSQEIVLHFLNWLTVRQQAKAPFSEQVLEKDTGQDDLQWLLQVCFSYTV